MQIIKNVFAVKVSFNGKPDTYDDVKRKLEEIKNSFDNPHVEVNKQVTEEDWISIMRTWTGAQVKKYHNLPPGKQGEWREISVVRLVMGKFGKTGL